MGAWGEGNFWKVSELQELWDEGGRNEAWHAVLDDLASRLTPAR